MIPLNPATPCDHHFLPIQTFPPALQQELRQYTHRLALLLARHAALTDPDATLRAALHLQLHAAARCQGHLLFGNGRHPHEDALATEHLLPNAQRAHVALAQLIQYLATHHPPNPHTDPTARDATALPEFLQQLPSDIFSMEHPLRRAAEAALQLLEAAEATQNVPRGTSAPRVAKMEQR